jgi:hypothetical protein
MTDEQQELRTILWNEIFAFTHIFKSFRMAIHPSKMLLALAAIVAITIGGWVLDRLWQFGGQQVMRNEVSVYASSRSGDFKATKDAWKKARPLMASELLAESTNEAHFLAAYTNKLPAGRLATAFAEKLSAANAEMTRSKPFEIKSADSFRAEADKNWHKVLNQAKGRFGLQTERIGKLLADAKHTASGQVKMLPGADRQKETEQLARDCAKAEQALTVRRKDFAEQVLAIQGRGVFASLLDYENDCVSSALSAVWRADLASGLAYYGQTGGTELASAGFLYWALMAVQGLVWLLVEHWIYAILFLLLCLAAWALFGGAVYRIAALHAAREEKISAVQAMQFSLGKFFSFLTAPLVPLAIVVVLGLLLALGGLLGNLGGLGAILVGVLFFVAIVVGLVVAFLLVGLTAGGALMYPTIAVEGSDSFDAISRSFSYVFARPWRSILYGGVALVHGALCYLFVRLFAFLALVAAHTFVGWGIWTGGRKLGEGATRLDVLWTAPTFQNLHEWTWAAMSGTEKLGAVLVGLWVYLVIGGVAAFLLSYLASSTTVIYYLLRRKVDATDLDDVYVEEGPVEPAPEPAAAASPTAEAEGESSA